MCPALPQPSYSTRKPSGWQEGLLVPLALLVLTALYFWPQVGRGRILYWGDIGLYFLPMTSFLRMDLAQGHLPLWNPLVLCGTPFVGNPQTWPAYPFSWLLPLFSAGYFLNLSIAFHVWLAALGMWVFLRRAEELGAQASFLGALVFGFGGQLVSKEQFPNMVQAIAWMPWILLAVRGVVAGRSVGLSPLAWQGRDQRLGGGDSSARPWAGGVALGVLLGLQILSAHAQMTLLTLYLAAAYGVCAWRTSEAPMALPVIGGRVAMAVALAVGLSLAQTLPTLELYASAWRQKLPFGAVDRFTLPLNQLANWALPNLHGSPFAGNFTGHGNYWETCCYVGMVGSVLATAGAVRAWRGSAGHLSRFWLGTAIVGVWMALGGKAGLYHVAYWILPGFRSFHDPARCLLWASWGVSVLAAWGFEWVQACGHAVRWWTFAACVVLVFGDLAHFGRTLYPLVSPNALAQAAPASLPDLDEATFAMHQGRVLSPDTTRVWQRFTRYKSFRQDAPNYLSLWRQTQTPNLPMLDGETPQTFDGMPQASGYEPLARRDAQIIVSKMTDALRAQETAAVRQSGMTLAGVMGVRTVVFCRVGSPQATVPGAETLQSFATLPLLSDKPAEAARVFVCRNAFWQERARFARRLVWVNSHAEAVNLVTRAVRDPAVLDLATTTVLVRPTGVMGLGVAPRLDGTGFASFEDDMPDRVEVRTNNSGPAVLVLADTLHPGWNVSVDGHRARLLSADGFLRAVMLPASGPHWVVFAYRPVSFLLGYYVSLLSVGIVVGFFVLSARAGRNLVRAR